MLLAEDDFDVGLSMVLITASQASSRKYLIVATCEAIQPSVL